MPINPCGQGEARKKKRFVRLAPGFHRFLASGLPRLETPPETALRQNKIMNNSVQSNAQGRTGKHALPTDWLRLGGSGALWTAVHDDGYQYEAGYDAHCLPPLLGHSTRSHRQQGLTGFPRFRNLWTSWLTIVTQTPPQLSRAPF